ncbi:MAG: rhodanese-like domain-containing protein [Cyclobacteriaceae bacterium]|nr:rhodanese-like domain-containing protein [Cyclobacteriaceae bacterium]
MKKIFFLPFMFLMLSGIVIFSNCQPQSAGLCTISAAEFAKMDKSNVAILDVRTPGEFNSGHVDGATMIDFSDSNFKSTIGQLDRDAHYYVYCKVGGRSNRATQYMYASGFKNVCNIQGGIIAIAKEGVTLEK